MQLNKAKINRLRQDARSIVRELGLLNDAYFGIGVTLAERHLLIELSQLKSATFTQIGDALLLDKSTTSRLIGKALKKGFLSCETDPIDKRKKNLALTPYGLDTLNRFETIAHDQTKQALLTLPEDQLPILYKGLELYAQGLKTTRLNNQNKQTPHTSPSSESTSIIEQLHSLGYTLEPYTSDNETELYNIFKEVVESQTGFPYESSEFSEFQKQFLAPNTKVYVCKKPSGKVVGGFYLKANYSGRSSHIANAAYMIHATMRGQGIGSLLVKASLAYAKEQGFHGMQFNMVLSGNTKAINLYEKLGFSIVGTIPNAVRNSDGTYQNGHVMYKNL